MAYISADVNMLWNLFFRRKRIWHEFSSEKDKLLLILLIKVIHKRHTFSYVVSERKLDGKIVSLGTPSQIKIVFSTIRFHTIKSNVYMYVFI